MSALSAPADLIIVTCDDPASADGKLLMEQLSEVLTKITGSSGKASFDANDVRGDHARFVIARDAAGHLLGCGAFRPLEAGVAEIKRMYARPGTRGVGVAVLAFLEAEAVTLGYRAVWLETRAVNQRAVSFYLHHGYAPIANYGNYAGNAHALCFAKRLSAAIAG